MAAIVQICEAHGAGETVTDNVSNINFGSGDVANLVPASYPITIPPTGTNYSYEKYIKIKCSGTYNKVDNLQYWHSAGTPSTGVSFYASNTANTTYATPVNTLSTKATNAVPTSDPGTANIGIDGSFTGAFESSETAYSNYLVLQMRVASTASPGNMAQITWTFQYDEQ